MTELIGDNWDEIHRLTKIEVKEDYPFNGMDGAEVLKAGNYYITGFWVDAMGLATTLEKARGIDNEFLVPSKALMYFYTE